MRAQQITNLGLVEVVSVRVVVFVALSGDADSGERQAVAQRHRDRLHALPAAAGAAAAAAVVLRSEALVGAHVDDHRARTALDAVRAAAAVRALAVAAGRRSCATRRSGQRYY